MQEIARKLTYGEVLFGRLALALGMPSNHSFSFTVIETKVGLTPHGDGLAALVLWR